MCEVIAEKSDVDPSAANLINFIAKESEGKLSAIEMEDVLLEGEPPFLLVDVNTSLFYIDLYRVFFFFRLSFLIITNV